MCCPLVLLTNTSSTHNYVRQEVTKQVLQTLPPLDENWKRERNISSLMSTQIRKSLLFSLNRPGKSSSKFCFLLKNPEEEKTLLPGNKKE